MIKHPKTAFSAGITDFGLSLIKGDSLESGDSAYAAAEDRKGTRGTARWMSPEVLTGSVGKAGDVYAYAMTLYQVSSQ